MEQINSRRELEKVYNQHDVIIEFGLAEGCIPCKMTKDNLLSLENDNVFNASYYFCSNIDIITELGYSAVPVIMVITKTSKSELKDSGISMDLDELTEWINEQLKK